jgi:hypothetical protein
MPDPLSSYLKEGYPKESDTSEGFQTLLEYVGPLEDLQAGGIIKGQTWGDYPGYVEDVQGEPITGTDPLHARYSVRMLRRFGSVEGESTEDGQEQETLYEIDWVDVVKPFIDHPAFGIGGEFEMGSSERLECLRWEEMDVPEYKTAYKFFPGRYSDWLGTEDELQILSGTNAEKYADGRLLGIEYATIKAPVLRKSTFYTNGVPPQDGGGLKEDPPADFPNVPPDYEWLRNADRSSNTGNQTEWRRDQEWVGAKKILVDSENLYY